MKQEELLELLNAKADESFHFDAIININHKPHHYMITPRHIKYCECGILDEKSIKWMEKNHKVKCGHENCQLTFEQHTSDTVIAVKCYREDWNKDLLREIVIEHEQDAKKLGVDGFVFVRSWND